MNELRKKLDTLQSHVELYQTNEQNRKEYAQLYKRANEIKYDLENRLKNFKKEVLEELFNLIQEDKNKSSSESKQDSNKEKITNEVLIVDLEGFDEETLKDVQDFIAGFTNKWVIEDKKIFNNLTKK